MSKQKLGRITESRTDVEWGRPAAPIKHAAWFGQQSYESARLSTGHETDRQWYAYEAASLILKGTADYEPIAAALTSEKLRPVKNPEGKAIVSLWLNEIKDAVCGAYHEIVVTVDATADATAATAPFGRGREPVGYLYNYFTPVPNQENLLHTLFINSPLSIAWGREMQAFPKHPRPVASMLEDGRDQFKFDLKWGDELVLKGAVGKRWGIKPFLYQATNLIAHFGLLPVTKYLLNPDIYVPILMPQKTADQYGVSRLYDGTIRKGLNPAAVQTWPWAATDQLEFGELTVSTGSEASNGHQLLKGSNFQPKICIYLPHLHAYVNAR